MEMSTLRVFTGMELQEVFFARLLANAILEGLSS